MLFRSKKSEMFQQLSDDFTSSTLLIDEIREKLINNKKIIGTLQDAVNSLQAERQLFKRAANKAEMQISSVIDTQDQCKIAAQKYRNWLNTIQTPLKTIYFSIYNSAPPTGKFTLIQMSDMIEKIPKIIKKIKEDKEKENEISKLKIKEYNALKEKIENEMHHGSEQFEGKVKEMKNDLLYSQKEILKLKSENAKLESAIKKRNSDHNKLYEKGIVANYSSISRFISCRERIIIIEARKCKK